MKIVNRPVAITIFFGMVCGLSFIPLKLVLDYWFFRPGTIGLTLWLFTAGYTLLLCLWSEKSLASVSFPVLFLFLAAFMVPSAAAFYCLAQANVSWIRSGLCYPEHDRKYIRIAVEIMLCAMAAAVVTLFSPATVLSWTAGIWMFFLLQALYFAIFEAESLPSQSKNKQDIDPFDRAYRLAKDILDAGGCRHER